MRNAYITFCSQEDREAGFLCLAGRSHVGRLSNGIFCIPWGSLGLLDDQEIGYRFATEEDLSDAQPMWNVSLRTSP